MKKIWLCSAAALMLAACNDTEERVTTPVVEEPTASQEETATNTPPQTSDETNNAATDDAAVPTQKATTPLEEADAETVDIEAEPVHEADAENVDDESAAAMEPSGEISYVQQNETYSAPTNFTTSSEQPFGLEVMDGFSLVAEEPGKDQLISTTDSRVAMAIETFTIGEVTYDDLFTKAMDKAASLGEVAPIEDLPASDNISNIAAFEVDVNGEKTVVMALETPSMLAQFTLMDTAERNYIDAMMQMAVTIQGQ